MGSSCSTKKDPNADSATDLLRKELMTIIPSYIIICRQHEQARLAVSRLSDFKRIKKIGSGRFNSVYCVSERRSNKVLAMKEVYRGKLEIYNMEPRLEREHIVLSELKSFWLVEMFRWFETPTKLVMLLEMLPGPSLVRVAKDGAVSPLLLRWYAAEMLMAILAVHRHGFIHRDIKLANFLLSYGHVKLCDFGSCIRFLPPDTANKVFPDVEELQEVPPAHVRVLRQATIRDQQFKPMVPHGTSYYCAPEVIRLATREPSLAPYTYLCDYWSYGVCLYYLSFRRLPFHSDHYVKMV
ncbi:serine/threonine-protein kinase WARTS homolog [Babylonia areolata]|uniref:serine/threonine-protein kinase WARTS homolog n=1 Tax=Babylonia areolata TaxID=304850 RepID=UPI003FD05822